MNTKSHHDKAFKIFTVKYDHIVQVLLFVLRIPSNLYLLSLCSLINVCLDVLKATLCWNVGYTFFGRSHDNIAYYAFNTQHYQICKNIEFYIPHILYLYKDVIM